MVAGELFEVFVAKVVAGTYHQGCTQLKWASPGVVLSVSLSQCPRSGHELARAYQRELAQVAGPDQFSR